MTRASPIRLLRDTGVISHTPTLTWGAVLAAHVLARPERRYAHITRNKGAAFL